MNAALSSPTITPGAIVVGDRMSPGVAGHNVNSIYIEVGDDNARIRRNVLDETGREVTSAIRSAPCTSKHWPGHVGAWSVRWAPT